MRFAIVLLILAATCMPTQALMAKNLPTTKALQDRLDGDLAGFNGTVESVLENVSDTDAWDQCIDQNIADVQRTGALFQELQFILKYYDIIGGSEEALDNFNKWEKDWLKSWPETLKAVDKCYTNILHQQKQAQ